MDTKRRHWTDADFRVVSESPAYDGSPAVNQSGYCCRCFADMQRFGRDGQHGPLRHYHSHETARRLGLWGTAKVGSYKKED